MSCARFALIIFSDQAIVDVRYNFLFGLLKIKLWVIGYIVGAYNVCMNNIVENNP